LEDRIAQGFPFAPTASQVGVGAAYRLSAHLPQCPRGTDSVLARRQLPSSGETQ
jgi:hypothetical protein